MRTEPDLGRMLSDLLARQLRLPAEASLSRDDLLEDIGLDSLGMLSFIAALERDFGCSISDRDYESLITFGDALDLVERLAR